MSFIGGVVPCGVCGKRVYGAERADADGQTFHKACMRCAECNCMVKLGSYAALGGKFYCKPHFRQLFARSGNYHGAFEGQADPKSKWLESMASEVDGQGKELRRVQSHVVSRPAPAARQTTALLREAEDQYTPSQQARKSLNPDADGSSVMKRRSIFERITSGPGTTAKRVFSRNSSREKATTTDDQKKQEEEEKKKDEEEKQKKIEQEEKAMAKQQEERAAAEARRKASEEARERELREAREKVETMRRQKIEEQRREKEKAEVEATKRRDEEKAQRDANELALASERERRVKEEAEAQKEKEEREMERRLCEAEQGRVEAERKRREDEEEEMIQKKREEEEKMIRKRREEEMVIKKKQEEEIVAQKKREEEEEKMIRKRREEEMIIKKKQEEEEARNKKNEEQDAKGKEIAPNDTPNNSGTSTGQPVTFSRVRNLTMRFAEKQNAGKGGKDCSFEGLKKQGAFKSIRDRWQFGDFAIPAYNSTASKAQN